jgi:hypothetical protein
MGTHGSPPTRVLAIPDRRARLTRRPADLSVGPVRPDLWAEGHEDSLEYKTRQTSTVLTVYFGTPNMFIILWSGFVYGTNPPLGTLII